MTHTENNIKNTITKDIRSNAQFFEFLSYIIITAGVIGAIGALNIYIQNSGPDFLGTFPLMAFFGVVHLIGGILLLISSLKMKRGINKRTIFYGYIALLVFVGIFVYWIMITQSYFSYIGIFFMMKAFETLIKIRLYNRE